MTASPGILIMVDMEGISGIFQSPQVLPDGMYYSAGRRYMTWDANACVEGCFLGGAKHVVVVDSHCAGANMVWEEFDQRAELIQGGTPLQRMPEIDSFDGVILLGYHAMAGTPQAILEHTMTSKAWQNLWINGVRSGEIAIDAGIAGDHNVPTIMVSGDDKACAEAALFIKGVVTAQVKKGLGCQSGQLLAKGRAHELITERAKNAVESYRNIQPYRVSKPVTMRLELVSRGVIPATRTGVKVIDGRTYEVTAATVEEALRQL